MRPRRIAVLSASVGAGHARCAEAIRLAAEARGIEAVHLDALAYAPRAFTALYLDGYLRLVRRRPALWAMIYRATDAPRRRGSLGALRRAIERAVTRRMGAALAELRPDAVVCTHFLPAQAMAELRARDATAPPTWVVVTDFDLHAAWVQRGLNGYCAPAIEVGWRMRHHGLDAPIAVTGIPLMPEFSMPPTRAVAVAELGLDPRRAIVLLMAGGLGMEALDLLAERLLASLAGVQVVAVAGANRELHGRLLALAARWEGRVLALGFHREMGRLMAAADLAITKTGGLTCAECLASGLPVVALSPLPGQEERNAEYLLEHGAAVRAYDATGVVEHARALLDDRERLAAMRARARRAARPRAAERVLGTVLAGLSGVPGGQRPPGAESGGSREPGTIATAGRAGFS